MSASDVSAVPGVLTVESPAERIERSAGGKGRGLYSLAAAGVSVPPWAIVEADVLRAFRDANGVGGTIEAELAALAPDADGELDAAAARIGTALTEAELDPESRAAIAAAWAAVGGGAVAVRSSALGEDGKSLSFAGQYTTVLNVLDEEAVEAAVKACWASAWSADALRYRLLNGLSLAAVEMAVVVQQVVAAEASGVLFTVNPASGDGDEFVVSAIYGLGEGVVSGEVDADTIVLERESGAIRRQTIGAKETRIDPLPDGGCATSEVAAAERAAAVLSEADLELLHREGRRLADLLGGPQDVEWALADGRLLILQSRPVTAGAPARDGTVRLWDNSNIIESYGDIVAPLTFSFASYAYNRVYQQYCELLGVPRRQLTPMEDWLPQLLGYFDGRVYYNLLNWYRLSRLIPFYPINRRVLEISIGTDPLDPEIADRQQPWTFRNRLEELYVRGKVAVRFFWYFATIHRLVDDFVEKFYRDYEEVNAIDFDSLEDHEIYALFLELEQRLLIRWGRMIMLEYSVGLSLGALYTLTQRWLPDAPEWFLYEAIKTPPDVESMKPLLRLDELAAEVVADFSLQELVRSLPAERLDAALRGAIDPPARALVEGIDAYLAEFGDRNANELKLEEPDLHEDPASFFALLKSAVGRLEASEAAAQFERPSASEYMRANLKGWRRFVWRLVRLRVRRLLADRERVRFCRTRIFGLVRRVFRACGREMVAMGIRTDPQDIFYLRLEELRGSFEGTVGHRELGDLIELRKRQEKLNRGHEVPPRFWTRGGVYWGALDRAWAEAAAGEAVGDGDLQGTPCCAGVVEGEARLVERPEDVEGNVLVTYRTDPGWVGVLRSASALLIERGSPLTHVAIVARELGIPTVVQIPGLTKRIRTGMKVRVDGGTGLVALEEEEVDAQ